MAGLTLDNSPLTLGDASGLRGAQASLHAAHFLPSLSQSTGGPAIAVAGLCEAMARLGCQVDLCTCDLTATSGADVSIDPSLVRVQTSPPSRSDFTVADAFAHLAARAAGEADVIHCHGIWTATDNCAARAARKRGKPFVISLHGMLAPRALSRSAWKKWLARLAYVRKNLDSAGCLHAFTHIECRDARAYGATRPIAIIPNGIHLPEFSDLPGPERAGARWPELKGKKLVLFLARLHPIKGLDILVEAWRRLAKDFPAWHLVIAGPDELGMREGLEANIREGNVEAQTSFLGPAFGQDKRMLLGAAGLYCQPSYSEGFSMSILEAQASSLPALITRQCNFPEVGQANAGVLADPTAASVADGLRRLLGMSDKERAAMGHRGRALIEQHYTWQAVAAKMIAVDNWLLGRADRPDFVHL